MVGAVGDDEFGGTLLQGLKRNGVDASGVSVVSRQRTGVAVIVVEEATGENRILLSEGANGCVTPASLQQAWLSSSSSGSEDQDENKPALVVLQLEIPLSTVVHVVQRARQRGVPVLLNPAPAPAQEMQREVYAGLEHLILNETEARTLSSSSSSSPPPSSPPHDDHNRTDTNNDDATAFMSATATHFHTLGVATVILTLGARGVFFSTEAADSGFVPAEKVDDVVDTTAAGDTFVGAYAVAVTEGWGVREAVGWANRAAGVSVRREGAMEAIPWRGEVGEVGVGE